MIYLLDVWPTNIDFGTWVKQRKSSSGGSGMLYWSLVQNITASCKGVTVKP